MCWSQDGPCRFLFYFHVDFSSVPPKDSPTYAIKASRQWSNTQGEGGCHVCRTESRKKRIWSSCCFVNLLATTDNVPEPIKQKETFKSIKVYLNSPYLIPLPHLKLQFVKGFCWVILFQASPFRLYWLASFTESIMLRSLCSIKRIICNLPNSNSIYTWHIKY